MELVIKRSCQVRVGLDIITAVLRARGSRHSHTEQMAIFICGQRHKWSDASSGSQRLLATSRG